MERRVIVFCLLFKTTLCNIGLRCDMIPEGVTAPRCKEDLDRFKIEISGNPDTYIPGEQYTVVLKSSEKEEIQSKFTHFILSIVNEKFEKDVGSESSVIGSLQLYGDTLTKFSDSCENAVVEADSQPKSEIQVLWMAPQKESGCIKFRATVVKSVDLWYSEDGELTKTLCEESPDSDDTQPKILQHCCTCDEAKYESDHIRTIIKARGISYPNITGKTFAVFRVDNRHHLMSIVSMIDPSPDWIVGVSSLELCLRNCSWIESKVLNMYPWDVGTDDGITYMSTNQPSSPRQPIKRLRTNIPNDPRSPFFDPTGTPMKPLARLTLSRQRLYEKSCDPSMLQEMDGNDANCDTEEWSEWSPCSATCGRGVKYKQRRYKNEESKYLCHKRLTERASCDAVQKYCPYQPKREIEDPLCELGPWSEWSSCSVTCGKGVQTRDRKYKNRLAAKSCAAGKINPPIMQQNLECWAKEKCDDFEEEDEEVKENCPQKPWSDWSPCSATCGKGFKERYRLSFEYTGKKAIYWLFFKNKDGDGGFDEDDPCNNQKVRETVECFEKSCEEGTRVLNELACGLPKDVGACKSNIDRWYFDTIKGQCEIFSYSGCEGNMNNFNTLEQCQSLCSKYQTKSEHQMSPRHLEGKVPNTDFKVDCIVTRWSSWSICSANNGICGAGYKIKKRSIMVQPQGGGHPCPMKLIKRRKCKKSCDHELANRLDVDCVMTPWSSWSKCGPVCENAYQHRYRRVLVYPNANGQQCSNKVEKRPCPCN